MRIFAYTAPAFLLLIKKPNVWFTLIMFFAHLFIGGHLGGVLIFTAFLLATINILVEVPTESPKNPMVDVFLTVLSSQMVLLCGLFLAVWHDGAVLVPAVVIAMCEIAQLQMFFFSKQSVKEEGGALISSIGRFLVALAVAGFLAVPLFSFENVLWWLDGPATILFWLVAVLSFFVFLIQVRTVFKI